MIKNIIKIDLQFLLVKFPIIFPLIYAMALYMFPSIEIYLIFFTILILAETHFGATWPFFLNNVNSQFIKENKLNLISYPILIVFFSLVGFIFFKPTFLLIFFAANVFHVTRQSYGICKLYTYQQEQLKIQEIFIYLFNFIFFVIGLLRFYLPIISNEDLLILNLLVLSFILVIIIYFISKYKFSENIYTFFTGIIIFYPICFIENPVHAIIMGVTMHYTQYLYLTHKVYKGRRQKQNLDLSQLRYIFIIIFYAAAMSILSLFGKSTNEVLSLLLVIPIIGQMLHFYLDSQLWKFSNSHNRLNVLNHLKN